MSLRLSVEIFGDDAVLWCSGRIVAGDETAAMWDRVRDLLAHRLELVVDISQVDKVDAGGLGTLIRLHGWAVITGREITFRNPAPRIAALLELVGLRSVLHICQTANRPLPPLSHCEHACGCG